MLGGSENTGNKKKTASLKRKIAKAAGF